jgi:hypothetical protein
MAAPLGLEAFHAADFGGNVWRFERLTITINRFERFTFSPARRRKAAATMTENVIGPVAWFV